MKSPRRSTRITTTLLGLVLLASASFAATQPLSFPYGIALDAKGNLYVANNGGNNILVYSPTYTQVKAKTITQGVDTPIAVAFDPYGNLWVANDAQVSTITEYTGGKQNTKATINGVVDPQAMAFDGTGNLWVNNQGTNVTIYAPAHIYAPPSVPIRSIDVPSAMYGLALARGTFVWGDGIELNVVDATQSLMFGASVDFSLANNQATAVASDQLGNFYVANFDHSVNIVQPTGQIPFAQLDFRPHGIVIDTVRGRVYFSNFTGNSISVYSTSGTLLHTIQ